MQINLNRILNHNPIIKLLTFASIGISLGVILPKKCLLILLVVLTFLGLIFLFFRNRVLAYIFITVSTGLILAPGFEQIKLLQVTNKFQEVKGKIFGEISEIFVSELDFASIRIVGTISIGNREFNEVPLLLRIYPKKDRLRKLKVKDKILVIASIRPPRRTNLPTDIAEISLALSHEVLFFARTSDDMIIRYWEDTTVSNDFLLNLRENLQLKLKLLFTEKHHSFFDAMLLGNKKLLENEQREKFAITGISHLLAISGFHFGVVFAIAFGFISLFPNKWFRFFLLCIFMLLYLCIINFPPSGIRAFIMIVAFLYANTLERKISPYNVLALIVLLLLTFKPNLVFSVGFQLSFLAVLGIVLFQRKLHRSLTKILPFRNAVLKFFLMMFSVTISAQLLVSPVVAYYFGYYTFISFFSNLFLVPVFSLSLTFGFFAMLFSFFSIEIGKIFAFPAEFLLSLGIKFNEHLAEKLSSLVINDNGVLLLSLLVSALIIWLAFSSNSKSFAFRFAVFIILILSFILNLNIRNYNKIEVFPRAKYIAVICRNLGKNYCLLFDRKPHLYPSGDVAMERYISRLDGDLIMGVSGNVGIAICDQIKKHRKIKIVEIPSNVQLAISSLIAKNQSIYDLGLDNEN